LKIIITKLGGSFGKAIDADFVIIHSKKICSNVFFTNKNVLNCKFITDSLLNMKIADDNIDLYKEFA